jgi:ribonuclease P protein component
VPPGRVGRLTSKATFAALQRSRRRGASGPVRAVFVPGPTGSAPQAATAPHTTMALPKVRVGYAVSKRCGSAVERNTLRRRMRAVARDTAPSLPGGSYLLRLSPEAGSLERARFRADVAKALRRAGGVPRASQGATPAGHEAPT